MYYLSTRDKSLRFSSAQAISQGLSREGGLFVPSRFPKLEEGMLEKLKGMDYCSRAVEIMSLFLPDYSREELEGFASRAYGPGYDGSHAAPVHKDQDGTYYLELWHGPTCAFKDMALQMLPHLLTSALVKTGEEKKVCILVATSGDTGKAALEGFCDVDRTRILVFYPRDGVSDIQKLQMVSQKGENVGVCAVEGNFDDAQTGVKQIFSSEKIRAELEEKGWFLSSANSINWGRLLPQIVYYISAYCDVCLDGGIQMGDEVNFCVPTGNFGDILAGYYAKQMGLPVGKLICASNKNDVLTQFIHTGVYDRRRPFYTTSSPSMDILVSSNLERLLYHLSGENDELVASYMAQLNENGIYKVNEEIFAALQQDFACGCADEEATAAAIRAVFQASGYLIDPHTAVATHVLKEYQKVTGDTRKAVVVSTASPYKFCSSVLEALGQDTDAPGLELIDRLENVSGTPAPRPLSALKNASVRFEGFVDKAAMPGVVEEFLH